MPDLPQARDYWKSQSMNCQHSEYRKWSLRFRRAEGESGRFRGRVAQLAACARPRPRRATPSPSPLIPAAGSPPHHSNTPELHHSNSQDSRTPLRLRLRVRLRLRKGRTSRVGHGLARVMSRVGREKRPVFIGLSRCHGSGPPGGHIVLVVVLVVACLAVAAFERRRVLGPKSRPRATGSPALL